MAHIRRITQQGSCGPRSHVRARLWAAGLRMIPLGSVGCVALPVFCLVSLSLGPKLMHLCGSIETMEECEIIEIASIHAVFMHVAENMVGWRKRLGEYPTLSPTLAYAHLHTSIFGRNAPSFSIIFQLR
jgi:hypothetical protein